MSYGTAYDIGNLSISSLSLIACLWLLYKLYNTTNRTIVMQIVLMITVFNLFQAIDTLVTQFLPNTKTSCIISEYFFNFNLWVSLLWSTALAILSYKSLTDPQKFCPIKFFTRCKWTIIPSCAIMAALPIFDFFVIHYVNVNNNFCGVIADAEPLALRIIFITSIQGLPLIAAISATLICYILQIKTLRNIVKEDENFCPEKLLWFPLIQLVVYLPQTLLGIADVINDQDQDDVLSLIFFCLTRFAGFANAVVYILLTGKKTAPPKAKESLVPKSPRSSKEIGSNAFEDSYDEIRVLKRALTNRYSLTGYNE